MNNSHHSGDQVDDRLELGGETDSGHDDDLLFDIPDNASDDQIIRAIQRRWPAADRPGIAKVLYETCATPAVIRTSIAQVLSAGGQGVGSLVNTLREKSAVARCEADVDRLAAASGAASELEQVEAEIEAGGVPEHELLAAASKLPGARDRSPDDLRSDPGVRKSLAQKIKQLRRQHRGSGAAA